MIVELIDEDAQMKSLDGLVLLSLGKHLRREERKEPTTLSTRYAHNRKNTDLTHAGLRKDSLKELIAIDGRGRVSDLQLMTWYCYRVLPDVLMSNHFFFFKFKPRA